MDKNNARKQKGIALLISVLIVSLVLAVSLSLMTFIVKQLKISFSSRESVISIYAADAGIECVLLWDIRGVELTGGYVFATSTGSTPATGGSGVECFNEDLPSIWTITDETATNAKTDFNLDVDSTGIGIPTYCAVVSVTKSFNGTRVTTSILSRGYNVPCSDINTAPNVAERAIRVNYLF